VRAWSQIVQFANDQLEMVVRGISSKKKKVENAAEKTGGAIGKDIKKGAKAVNDFGKGLKKSLKKKE
jgi:hypothetical protein